MSLVEESGVATGLVLWVVVGVVGLALCNFIVQGLIALGRQSASAGTTVVCYMVIIEPDEDGVYIATVPAVPGVVDQGDTPEEAFERAKESLHFALLDGAVKMQEAPLL